MVGKKKKISTPDLKNITEITTAGLLGNLQCTENVLWLEKKSPARNKEKVGFKRIFLELNKL